MNKAPQCKSENVQILKENIGITPHFLGFGNEYLAWTPKTQFKRKKIEKLEFIKSKLNSLVPQQTLSTKGRENSQIGENICKSYI